MPLTVVEAPAVRNTSVPVKTGPEAAEPPNVSVRVIDAVGVSVSTSNDLSDCDAAQPDPAAIDALIVHRPAPTIDTVELATVHTEAVVELTETGKAESDVGETVKDELPTSRESIAVNEMFWLLNSGSTSTRLSPVVTTRRRPKTEPPARSLVVLTASISEVSVKLDRKSRRNFQVM